MGRVGAASRHSAFILGWQVAAPGGGWQDNILGSQVSAIGYRVRVFGFRCRSRAGPLHEAAPPSPEVFPTLREDEPRAMGEGWN
jgi:hypothetical protein